MQFKKGKVVYYNDTTDDMVTSKQQHFQLPNDYQWKKNKSQRFAETIFQKAIKIFAYIYCHWFLHIRYVNADRLAHLKTGAYVYANHTLTQGDAFSPFNVIKHPSIIIAPANLGVPILGRWLPLAGALPIPSQRHDLPKFEEAVYDRVKTGETIVIYPEAHVWPYATEVRPFSGTSFHYPCHRPAPVYVMTTTYQSSRWHRRPNITVFIDGPFWPDLALPLRLRQQELHDQVAAQLKLRSKNSNYAFVDYRRRPEA